MAALLAAMYRLGAIASRQKSFVTLYNLQNVPTFTRTQCFQKSVLPSIQKSSIHSSRVLQQETVAKKEEIGSPHWKTFRYISVIMIGVYPAAILAPTPVIDWAITIFFPLHSYWGTKEVLSDYLPEIFPSTKAVTTAGVYTWAGLSVLTFLGLAYLNIYDVGVCKAVAMLWKL